MQDTVTAEPAAELERLREQVLDLGEQVTALTAGLGLANARISAIFEVMRRVTAAVGVPQAAAPLDEVNGTRDSVAASGQRRLWAVR